MKGLSDATRTALLLLILFSMCIFLFDMFTDILSNTPATCTETNAVKEVAATNLMPISGNFEFIVTLENHSLASWNNSPRVFVTIRDDSGRIVRELVLADENSSFGIDTSKTVGTYSVDLEFPAHFEYGGTEYLKKRFVFRFVSPESLLDLDDWKVTWDMKPAVWQYEDNTRCFVNNRFVDHCKVI